LGTPGEEVRTTPAQQKDLFPLPQKRRKDRVDRQRVFEEGMKVTRAVRPDQQRAESAAGDEPRRSVSQDAKAMEVPRERLNDPQRLRSLVHPHCHLGSSREEADGPEGPMNFREAAEVLRNRGQPFRRENL
jgi:hypothetical protein